MAQSTSLFRCRFCSQNFTEPSGCTRHENAAHRDVTQEPDEENDESRKFHYQQHGKATGRPCDRHGDYLPPHIGPDLEPSPTWHPFKSRVEFDFAHYHFVEEQSSAPAIKKALDIWAASLLEAGSDHSTPWRNADDLYDTIDTIQQGAVPWKSYKFRYTGDMPENPPTWMTETYELVTRDSRQVLHAQLASPDFRDNFNTTPYRQFQPNSERVWSNLMSADWAWKQADTICTSEDNDGILFVPVISGSDKTTVSVATGHQEYHPVYQSPGNLTNTARRGHGSGVLPTAFLPIPKAPKVSRKTKAYQTFVRQLYHACLATVFEPLREGMTTPEVVRCPDGHYRRAIYGLGPYIADYPEQVWLSAIVQNWCPKCTAHPKHLDNDSNAIRRSHRITEFQINEFDPGVLWDDYGVRSDVTPFTANFPRADIHELLTPDLLHEVIKGTFKDHLITWVMEYLFLVHTETEALHIIKDIDRRIAAVPAFPGLRRFPEGREFSQWTGDDSKALMKVYIAAIAGYVPSDMVKALSAFLDFCYLVRRNAITQSTLGEIDTALARFHQYRQIFIDTGVRVDISLPRQHSLMHYPRSIVLFGSPNGLCSSITESKHIKAVKEPWRRSSRFRALLQMVTTICRLDKLGALRVLFEDHGMMDGTTLSYTAMISRGEVPVRRPRKREEDQSDDDDDETWDIGPSVGPKTMSSISLASTLVRGYPRRLHELATFIAQPRFPDAFRRYLHQLDHPEDPAPQVPIPLQQCPPFSDNIYVHLSAVARFYAPSDTCGAGGMYRERIRSNPNWYGQYARSDTVFVALDADTPGMAGMAIARVLLFFSFTYRNIHQRAALVHWLMPEKFDEDTGMWVVRPEYVGNQRTLEVIPLDSIARGAHLLPVYGSAYLPERFDFSYSLDAFGAFYVNRFVDHHTHEFLGTT